MIEKFKSSESEKSYECLHYIMNNLPLTMQNIDIEIIGCLLPEGYYFLSSKAEKLKVDYKYNNPVDVNLLVDYLYKKFSKEFSRIEIENILKCENKFYNGDGILGKLEFFERRKK